MRLLRVLDLAVVAPRRVWDELLAVQLTRLCPRRRQRRLGQRGRVGAHVGDVAALVQPLGDAHRRLGREAKLARSLLLEGRGHEGRGRAARVYGFSSTERTAKSTPSSAAASKRASSSPSCRMPSRTSVRVGTEIAALRDPLPVELDQPRREAAGIEGALDVPVRRGHELHPFALALDDEPRRHRLDAAGRQPGHHLLPEHGRDLVAVEPVEDPPRLLRVDEALVDFPGMPERVLDRALRDLVEDHAAGRDLGLEDFLDVPGDRLPFAVFVRREQELVGVLQLALQPAITFFLSGSTM